MQILGGQTISILKSVLTLIIVWFLGLQYTLIAQSKDTPIDQMKNNQTNNDSKKETIMNTPTNSNFNRCLILMMLLNLSLISLQ